jgi:hypothetical protein
MKHLIKYNELRSTTYKSAGDKLTNTGKKRRGEVLKKHAVDVEKKEIKAKKEKDLEAWENQKNKYSKFGKYNMMLEGKHNYHESNFYVIFSLNVEHIKEEVEYLKDVEGENRGYFQVILNLVPADQGTFDLCKKEESYLEDEMVDGHYRGPYLYLGYKMNGGSMEFTSYDFNTDDVGSFTLRDRGSAGRFKNTLKKLFSDPNLDYPVLYDYSFNNFYDMANVYVGSTLGLSNDFGYSPEMVADFIKGLNVNDMYKEQK